VYVTTSFFSEAVQREVIEDEYPVLLVHGRRLASEVLRLADDLGKDVPSLLSWVDQKYKGMIQHRRPEEILLF
jgi:hypothetical protein